MQPLSSVRVLAFAACAASVTGSCGAHSEPASRPAPVAGQVLCVTVSVDWEGAFLEEADLAAMERFEADLPEVPLTHFLSAGYFTKPGVDGAVSAAAMARVIRDTDERGLHVHAWESLVEAAGATPLDGPSFLADEPLELDGEGGFDIELPAYPAADLRAVVATSRALLEARGFSLSRSFRAGGWLADQTVLQAARAEGFDIDSSSTDAAWLDELPDAPLARRVREVWPQVTRETQPFWIDTDAGRVLEMPDTGGLADYATEAEMVEHLGALLSRTDLGEPRFAHIGFHQEGAADYAPRVVAAIQALDRELGPARHGQVVFETLERCAARVPGSKRAR